MSLPDPPRQLPEGLDLSPLRLLLDRIEARYHPEEVWLFGSRARGDWGPHSDWDLLVVVPDETPESDLDLMAAWDLQSDLPIYADVIPCWDSEFHDNVDTVNTLSYVVAREGVRIDEYQPADREFLKDRETGSRRSAAAGSRR